MTSTFKQGFVINLARRPDRYASFARVLPIVGFPILRWDAVDGGDLHLDSQLMGRVRPNLKSIPELKLCRIIACSLSHLSLWRHISTLEDGWYIIFEDDALLASRSAGRLLNLVVDHLPSDAQLVWFNEIVRFCNTGLPYRVMRKIDAVFGLYRLRRFVIQLYRDVLAWVRPPRFRRYSSLPITSEAYALTPATAQKLHDKCINSFDSADVNLFIEVLHGGIIGYECVPPIFCQDKQLASDIDCISSVHSAMH